MNQNVIQKLREWRSKKGREENVELFRIFQNKTLEDFATILPRNKDELLAIKGIKEKKFQKYGKDILSIVAESTGQTLANEQTLGEKKIYSVSGFLDLVNSHLDQIKVSVKGEVSSVDIRKRYLFFTIKDAKDDSCMNCFMWTKDYELSGIELEEGLEIIAHGNPEIYAKTGRFSFQTEAIELVGEGVLKKRYDELKKKLTSEGLFDLERKKPLPDYPQKIGLITSKDGAVIHDFQTNLGRFGYKITFVDSRVEGMMAVKDLISAIRYFKDKPIDILVVIRGGGSLESLQAFNNEALIREIVNFPIPIICGVGHDKDIPLFSLVADKAVSTPTAVTSEINRSWEEMNAKINQHESNILNQFQMILNNSEHFIEQSLLKTSQYYQRMLKIFESFEKIIEKVFSSFNYILKYNKERIENIVKSLDQNSPERQLKLGYSIMFSSGKVVKSIGQVQKNDLLESKLADGEIVSIINKINKKE